MAERPLGRSEKRGDLAGQEEKHPSTTVRCTRMFLGVDLIHSAFDGVDKPQFAGIGHQELVTALLKHSANPGRVGSCLYGDAHGLLSGAKRRLKASGVVRSRLKFLGPGSHYSYRPLLGSLEADREGPRFLL
jgi:hypothetical protein